MARVKITFRDRILQSLFLWLLTREDGSFRVAAPSSFPGLPPGTPLRLGAIAEALSSYVDRGVLVSIPRIAGDTQRLRDEIYAAGGRALDDQEWRDIQETGMQVAFGEWADREWADLFLVEPPGRMTA